MKPDPQSGVEKSTRPRVTFPLWAKLGLVFGGLVGVAIASFGYYLFQADVSAAAIREDQT